MDTALRTLDDDDLVRVSGGHPLIRHLLPHRLPAPSAWSYGGAVAIASNYWEAEDGGDTMLVGPPDDAAELARRLAPQGRSLSMPTAAYELVEPGVLNEPSPWSFRWTDTANGTPRDAAAWIDDRTAVGQLLDQAYPDASVREQSARVRAWAGIHDDDGRLIACAADTSEAPRLGFVAAIATRPDLRGQGIGRRISGWIIDRLVEREGVVALWHYGSNAAAARVYDALGMQTMPMVAATPC